MFTSQQHNSNHHIPANSDGTCHRVRQARVLVGVPGRASNRRDRLGPRLPVLSSVYHANSIVEAALLPLRIEGRGPQERMRTKNRASRTSAQSLSISPGCQIRVVRQHLGRTTTGSHKAVQQLQQALVNAPREISCDALALARKPWPGADESQLAQKPPQVRRFSETTPSDCAKVPAVSAGLEITNSCLTLGG